MPLARSLTRARSRLVSLVVLALTLLSCSEPVGDDSQARPRLGSVAQALTDVDGDGMDDDWEIQRFGNLSQTGTGDVDADGMTNVEEYLHGFNPNVEDSLEDADGDRYPNVFEVRSGTNPNLSTSVPAPTYVVNGAGGGTHTTVNAALTAANVANGAYQIIGIAPGVYTGAGTNLNLWILSTKPTLLIIGLEGAAKTIIDGGLTSQGWNLQNSVVISSLTFQKVSPQALQVNTTKSVRLVDLLIRDCGSTVYAGAGLAVGTAGKIHIVGSTFLNNKGAPTAEQIWLGAGAVTMVNTAVWGTSTGTTMVAKSTSATLTTSYCLVKGQTLTGTGNIAGSVDPKLRSDGRLLWNSPLRGAGGSVPQSRLDMDVELRPSSAPDIGVDQFTDADSDELADNWELNEAGNLTTLTSRSQDADGDGLTNDQEYVAGLKPVVADTDGDGVSDGAEVNLHGTNPLMTDTDGDDMPDGWELAHGLLPLVANGLEDADGDRYPNVFEYARSTDPNSSASVPAPTYVVNGAGGGTHTTVNAALTAANVQNGAYQIIGIAPGVYTGSGANLNLLIASTKPTLLIIGLEGAARTIIDGSLTNGGWSLQNSVVISSLTFQKTTPVALQLNGSTKPVRLVDLVIRDNVGTAVGAGVNVSVAGPLHIVGSTFINNKGAASAEQIWLGAGAVTMVNTAVWGTSTGTMMAKSTSATLTTSYSLVKGQTLAGTGNLAGNADPKFRSDARLRSDSPLRAAGGTVLQSRVDFDGELRPSNAPDIGADQFKDADIDGLPDAWEIAKVGNTTSISGTGDQDSDGLNNLAEYNLETDWLDPDTDNDGVKDGLEVALGTNPSVVDIDDMGSDLNQDGLIESIGVQLGYQPNQLDDDGDSISNADETLMCTDALRADSDGDGVPDNTDAFPLDPRRSALVSDPQDVVAPVITLTAPWYAVPQ